MDVAAHYVRSLRSDWRTASLVAVGSALALGVGWVVTDYRAWLNFGTGGTPPNFRGYMRITRFRILRALSGDDLADSTRLSSSGQTYLSTELKQRRGPKPKIISWTLPQRQQPEPLDQAIYDRLHTLPQVYAELYPNLLTLDKSITEGRSTDAIYARPELPGRKLGAHDNVLGHEIAHVHPAENSVHVWLTEADAKAVIAKGWGERFPLSSLGMTHDGFIFLYAPQSMEDVDVIETIVKAAISHLVGEKIE